MCNRRSSMFHPCVFTGGSYYARYDGGVDTSVNEAFGTSSYLVGRAIASDTLYSLVRKACLSEWGTVHGVK